MSALGAQGASSYTVSALSEGMYVVQLPGHLDAVQVDEWMPCLSGGHEQWEPAFGSAGQSIWSLLVTKAYAKLAGSFDTLFEVDLMHGPAAIDRGSDPLERILLQPCAAMAHKLSTVWPSEGSSEQWLAEQFMQHEADEALVGKQREAKLMHYWVACESDCASTDEHVLSCCIQAEHSTTLRLTLSSSATGEAFLCDKLEITDTEQPVCFELLLQRSYFMDDGPLQLTLEQAGQMECSTNAMSVAFWSKGSTLTVTQSNASNL